MNNQKNKFEFLEHTADSKFRAKGNTLEEAFENAALATFETMIDTEKIDANLTEKINISSQNYEELFYNWLSELIYIFSFKNIVFKDFEVRIKENKKKRLRAKAIGEKIDLNKHNFETEVKAITYHQLKIEKDNGYTIEALLDT